MEEEREGLSQRTVECLRGRLLAERQVSKSAKEEAEIITRKIEELEKRLKEEMRLREKAEKRLKYVMKKLQFIKSFNSSQVSCLSLVSNSCQDSISKLEDDSSGEVISVVGSKSSHEEESEAVNYTSPGTSSIDCKGDFKEQVQENIGRSDHRLKPGSDLLIDQDRREMCCGSA